MIKGLKKKYNNKLFYLAVLGVFICYLFYYWKMTRVFTDINAHEWISRTLFSEEKIGPLQALAYPLYHLVLHGFGTLLQDNYVLAETILISFSNVLIILLLRWVLHQFWMQRTINQNYLMDFICVTAVMFLDIVGPLTQGRFYQGQCGPNPLHNPTTIFMKPFAILTFYYFVKVYQGLWAKEKTGKYEWGYTIILLLSVLAKPSGAFVMLPAFAIMTVALMAHRRSIRPGIRIFLETLPSVMVLIWQFFFYVMDRIGFFEFWFQRVFQPLRVHAAESMLVGVEVLPVVARTGSGFQISFGSFYGFNFLQVIAVTIAACLIPMLALCCLKEKKHWESRMPLLTAMLVLGIAWLEMFSLTNGGAGDFSWGYGFAVQMATILGLVSIWMTEQKKWLKWTSLAIYGYQVGCGIVYMILTYQRNEFWF